MRGFFSFSLPDFSGKGKDASIQQVLFAIKSDSLIFDSFSHF